MFLGGCTGSTAGSIKTYRLQAMARITSRYVDQLFSPRRVMKLRYGNRAINEEIILSILAFLTAFAGSIIAVTLALTLFGVELLTAFSGAVTAITNVGPGLGREIGPSGNFTGLPSGAKVVLIFAMILGRLEFFCPARAVVAALLALTCKRVDRVATARLALGLTSARERTSHACHHPKTVRPDRR